MIDDHDREDLEEARRDRAAELRDIARDEDAADQEERAAAAARLEELELHVAAVPVLDTGLGREAGFANDAELIAAAAAERAAMTPAVRAVVEELEDDLTRRVLYGGESRA